MHRFIQFAALMVAAGLSGYVCPPATLAQDPDPEPPLAFELIVDGKAMPITPDREIEIEADGKTTIRLVASATRNFAYAGFNFLYPNNFTYECTHSDGSLQWMLDGNNVVLMVFAFPEVELDAAEFAGSIATSYDDYDIDDCRLRIGGERRDGQEIRARFEGEEISQQIFGFPADDGTRLLIIQDTLADRGEHTDEYERIVKMLDESFRIASDNINRTDQ